MKDYALPLIPLIPHCRISAILFSLSFPTACLASTHTVGLKQARKQKKTRRKETGKFYLDRDKLFPLSDTPSTFAL